MNSQDATMQIADGIPSRFKAGEQFEESETNAADRR